ncbi:MAG: vanadium-dependent haloperoxidase, partial [Candidatus Binatia bacterium]
VWYQKWYVHRRLRPEEFGGRVHHHLTGAAIYPIDAEILNSEALQQVHSRYGAYFLPQAYPEGCPLHPSYGSGHATVAGACVTVLKAWFDESFVLPNPVVANGTGTALIPYTGPDAGSLTVGGELNKVAANIASGRNFAGIHWRTDYTEAFKLGEAVAIGILRDQKNTYKESFAGFSLTKFDGATITV